MPNIIDSLEKFNLLLQICNKNSVKTVSFEGITVTFNESGPLMLASQEEIKPTDDNLALFWSSEA